jgi:hypothetical protein
MKDVYKDKTDFIITKIAGREFCLGAVPVRFLIKLTGYAVLTGFVPKASLRENPVRATKLKTPDPPCDGPGLKSGNSPQLLQNEFFEDRVSVLMDFYQINTSRNI